MLKLQPTLDIRLSNGYQVRTQVDEVKSCFIQSASDNIAEHYNLHRFESAAVHLEFIESLLADTKYLIPIAERVEGGVCGPTTMQGKLKSANEWLVSTLLPSTSNPVGNV